MKKIVYIDMDNVLVDFRSAFDKLEQSVLDKYKDNEDEIPNIFSLMIPMDGAIEAFNKLASIYDVYILSTAPWNNPTAWSDKLLWVQKYLGDNAHKRLIMSHHKNLNQGDYLIDDRLKNGADKFQGEHIYFGQDKFLTWNEVVEYLT